MTTSLMRDPAFAAAFSILSRLVDQIEQRNPYSTGHSGRVADLAFAVGRAFGMTQRDLDLLQVAGHAHDIGMLVCPDEVLWTPGPLGLAGKEILRRHVEAGARIVEGIALLAPAAEWIRTHHERWDGTGYPRHLKGEEIPVGGRVLAVCEVFVGMTSDRPHRRALAQIDVLRHIRGDSGRAFDPRVVDAFLKALGSA